jgi:hypothetical protein
MIPESRTRFKPASDGFAKMRQSLQARPMMSDSRGFSASVHPAASSRVRRIRRLHFALASYTLTLLHRDQDRSEFGRPRRFRPRLPKLPWARVRLRRSSRRSRRRPPVGLDRRELRAGGRSRGADVASFGRRGMRRALSKELNMSQNANALALPVVGRRSPTRLGRVDAEVSASRASGGACYLRAIP